MVKELKNMGSRKRGYFFSKSIHEGIRYKCPSCAFEATHQTTLKLHIESSHEGIKYKVSHCHNQISIASNARGHFDGTDPPAST